METIFLTCIECPMGCGITVEKDGDKIVSVTGNTCPRGKMYAENEVTCPRRVLTTTVRAKNGVMIPVKTNKPIKKAEMFSYIETISKSHPSLPIKIGDVIIHDIEEGIDVVAADNAE